MTVDARPSRRRAPDRRSAVVDAARPRGLARVAGAGMLFVVLIGGIVLGTVDLAPATTLAILVDSALLGLDLGVDLGAQRPRRSSWTCACRGS